MRYALINGNGLVVEIIESESIDSQFHPDFVAKLTIVDDLAEVGMIYDGKNFAFPAPAPEPTIEKLRAAMVIRADAAQLKLSGLGLFEMIDDAIMALPRSAPERILWLKAPEYHRLNATVNKILDSLGFDEIAKDKLFTD